MALHDLALHLLSSTASERDIPDVIDRLGSHSGKSPVCLELVSCIALAAQQQGKEHGLRKSQIESIVMNCACFKSGAPEKVAADTMLNRGCHRSSSSPAASTVERKEERALLASAHDDPSLLYDVFPDQWCSLDQLGEQALRMKKDLSLCQKILDEIQRRTENDPRIRLLSTHDAEVVEGGSSVNPPYDQYRAGRMIPGVFFSGSEIKTSLQHFILMECPKGPIDTSGVFETVIHENVGVMVSLNQLGEPEDRYYDFWENGRLRTLTLRDGWRIEKVAEEEVDRRPSVLGATRAPRLVKTTLLGTQGQARIEIIHFHYDGWPNACPMPSEELLDTLYARIESLNPSPRVPIVINCKWGKGRSGTVAVGFYLRRLIDQLVRTRSVRQVNIPEIIYREFRRCRAGVMKRPAQLAQVYSMASQYYQKVQMGSMFSSLS